MHDFVIVLSCPICVYVIFKVDNLESIENRNVR